MNEPKLRDATEIDVIVDCDCGTSFRAYLPDILYACPNCSKLYRIHLVLSVAEKTDEELWNLVGQKTND